MLIDAPVQKIWDEILDVHKWPEWKDFVKSTKFSGQALAPGSKFKMKIQVKGPAMTFAVKITDFDEQKVLAWQGGLPGGLTAKHGFIFEPKDGKTNVISWEEFKGPLVGLMLKLVKPKDLESLHHRWLIAIKQRVEK